jgi:uncharacterized protein (DUF1499 family)
MQLIKKESGRTMRYKLMGVFLVIAVLIVAVSIVLFVQNRQPQIELGMVDGQFYELNNKPNNVSTQTSYENKRISTLAFKGTLEESKRRFIEAMKAYPGIEIIKEEDTYIYAVATTNTLKFHDDIEVYFDSVEQVIHYRSASRAGYSDGGLNRRRYEAISGNYND